LPVVLASVSAVGISIGAISAEPPRARRNDASAGWDSARANRHRTCTGRRRQPWRPNGHGAVLKSWRSESAGKTAVFEKGTGVDRQGDGDRLLPARSPACKGVLDAPAKQVHQSNVNW